MSDKSCNPDVAADPCDPSDRTVFVLDPERWAAFMAVLDAPPRPNPRLERLLKEPSVLE